MEAATVQIEHPNREKPQSKATKAGIVLLLVVSAALIMIVLIGGWSKLAGAHILAFGYVIVYLIMAYFVAARWSRGVLPLSAGMGIIFISMAAVAAPAWFARDKEGLADPILPPGLLGLLVLVIIAVQVLLIVFAMRGFQQEWNVEIEVGGGDESYGDPGQSSQDQHGTYGDPAHDEGQAPYEAQRESGAAEEPAGDRPQSPPPTR